MDFPRVSVIIPAYNQANYLAEAVQSVLDQTLSHLEVIVVNDASTDHTDEVMSQFKDPRLKYIVHEQNRYAAAARNTGIRTSSGELIAFLDADDLIHPKKLEIQVAFLEENPNLGLTYNPRFEIDESGLLLSISQTPPVVTLSDLMIDFPFAPSEVVMRKAWAFQVGLFDESFISNAEDPDFFRRLALQGCEMASVSRILNYRRLYVGRVYRNLAGVVEEQIRAVENIFADPRCPPEVLALREQSLANTYMVGVYDAFLQDETALGQDLIRKVIQYNRSILDAEANRLLEFLVMASIRNGGDHEAVLRRVLAQLPPELEWVTQYCEPAVAYGYLLRGTRDIMWGRTEQGAENFNQAATIGCQPDERYLRLLTSQLLNHDAAFGYEAAQSILRDVTSHLRTIGTRKSVRWLRGCYYVNRAFQSYYAGEYSQVPRDVIRAILDNPQYLANRGAMAILLRSMFGLVSRNFAGN